MKPKWAEGPEWDGWRFRGDDLAYFYGYDIAPKVMIRRYRISAICPENRQWQCYISSGDIASYHPTAEHARKAAEALLEVME